MSQEPAQGTPPSGGPPMASREASAAWRAFAYLLSGPLLYGGIGMLLDRWLGTGFLLPVGILGGMALSMYVIWLRYGSR